MVSGGVKVQDNLRPEMLAMLCRRPLTFGPSRTNFVLSVE